MITMQIKKTFFDRAVVINAMDRATRKALSRAGAFVRQRAKSSIRKRKAVSSPGSPPSSHTGLLRKWILFGAELQGRRVLIGPVALRNSGIPNALEFGGTTVATRYQRGRRERVTQAVEARPFMGPALEAESPNIPKRFQGAVHRG